jgi:predicted O-linked N-acetylglucosamine transferase (SPINDLY family)
MSDHNGSAPPSISTMQAAEGAYNAGDWTTAGRLCTQVLAVDANNADALNLLGIIKAQSRQPLEAAALLERASAAQPDNATLHNNYGNVLRDLARHAEAVRSFDRALQIQPSYPEALCNRGSALQALGQIDEALRNYDEALRLRPGHVEAHYNRGVALQDLGRFEEAAQSYGRALKLQPTFAEAHYNTGSVLHELKRFEDAVKSYDNALRIRDSFAEAHNNRGNALLELGRLDEALRSYERAIQVLPNLANAHNNRGNALSLLKRPEEALASYERALSLDPDFPWARGASLHAKLLLCNWDGIDAAIEDLIARVAQGKRATRPFTVLALSDDPSLHRRVAEMSASTAELAPRPVPMPPKRPRSPRIIIGYYSADYQNHATANLMAELFELHDRRRFEIIGFSYGTPTHDPMRQRLLGAFDRFVEVRLNSDREIAQLSRELKVDIAVDLKGFTQDSRPGIFAHRAAPIQVNYLGYPGTVGGDYMDYIVADRTLIPPQHRRHYSEHVIYLPNSYQANDRKRPTPTESFAHADLGLPQSGFIFCSFNSCYKITPTLFDGWMRILQRVKHSILWLLTDSSAVAGSLRREAGRRGVSADRLVFAPQLPLARHLARYRVADLFLDTFPCGGHTTASDALWAGLPVLTRLGESFAARVAASLLTAIGLPELITSSAAQYEALAVELATDPLRLAAMRKKLALNRPTAPLFDTPRFTRDLEQGYVLVYERYLAGLAPDDTVVT